MKKIIFQLILIILGIFCLIGQSEAATYYAAPKGSLALDNAAGGSGTIDDPWSIKSAMANAQAGDAIYFRGGTYQAGQSVYNVNNSFYFPVRSGTAENPIVFKAYDGERPIINGNVNTYTTGIAGEGTTTSQLVDTTKDFTALGLRTGNSSSNVRTRDTANGGSWISSVSANIITLNAPNTAHNTLTSFAPGDYYEIGSDSTFVLGNQGGDGALRSHITFDGFTIQANNGTELGGIYMEGPDDPPFSEGNIIKNCTFIGPSVKKIIHGDNKEFIFLRNNDKITIQNCVFHDLYHINGGHNTSAIKMYYNTDPTIENCEIYNTTLAIFDKGRSLGATYRNNYLHNNDQGIIFTGYAWTNPDGTLFTCTHRDVKFYNNLVTYSKLGSFGDTTQEWSDSNGMEVYNNTFYTGNARAVSVGLGGGTKRFYNNIIIGLPVDNDIRQYRLAMAGTIPVQLDESDYNQFGNIPSSFGVKVVKPDPNNSANKLYLSYTTLSNWQNSGELYGGLNPDSHSIASDPLFANSSGRMDAIADFALRSDSPCKGTGKNGADIGADVSLVGADVLPLPEDEIMPATPSGLSVS